MNNITKKSLNEFINKSAKQYNMSRESYLENVASKCYVVMLHGRPLCFDEDDTQSIMVLRDKENAEFEAKDLAGAKVMTELEMYQIKGAFSNAA